MKRVRIVALGEHYDKQVLLVSPNSGMAYDEEVFVVQNLGEPYDWAVQAYCDLPDNFKLDLTVQVTNPDVLPEHLRRLLGIK